MKRKLLLLTIITILGLTTACSKKPETTENGVETTETVKETTENGVETTETVKETTENIDKDALSSKLYTDLTEEITELKDGGYTEENLKEVCDKLVSKGVRELINDDKTNILVEKGEIILVTFKAKADVNKDLPENEGMSNLVEKGPEDDYIVTFIIDKEGKAAKEPLWSIN